MSKNRIVYHGRKDATYDIPYYSMPLDERNAINFYEPVEEVIIRRPWQELRNECKGQDPMKWPGNWKQTLDEQMYLPTETMGNYSIHNTVMDEVSQLNHNLSKSDERWLLHQAAEGDLAARNRVIEAHLSLAYKIASTQKRAFKRLEFTEMLAEAFAEVTEQVQNIVNKIKDGDTNHKRIYTVIHQPIIYAIKNRGSKQQSIRPASQQKLRDVRIVKATAKDLFLELLRQPEDTEVMDALGWGELRFNNTKFTKMFSTVAYDKIGDDNPILQVWDENLGSIRDFNLEELVDWCLNNELTEDEATTIENRYGIGVDETLSLNACSELMAKPTRSIKRWTKSGLEKIKQFFIKLDPKYGLYVKK